MADANDRLYEQYDQARFAGAEIGGKRVSDVSELRAKPKKKRKKKRRKKKADVMAKHWSEMEY